MHAATHIYYLHKSQSYNFIVFHIALNICLVRFRENVLHSIPTSIKKAHFNQNYTIGPIRVYLITVNRNKMVWKVGGVSVYVFDLCLQRSRVK